jgi:isoleucyl-tRNA synthetase
VELGTERIRYYKKEDIESISIEEYNEACKKNRNALYRMEWFDWKNGLWVDMEDPYDL